VVLVDLIGQGSGHVADRFTDPRAYDHTQAVIIITVTRLLSLGTKFLKQPRVIMEVVGGILLGAF
jgi:Kef-type K+ transport system membrane component KefB